jgi:hypothetical protein
MLWRHLCLVRAWSAAGLVTGLLTFGASASAQTSGPVDPEKSSPPAEVVTETVDLLKASKAGSLDIVARGQGQERVHLTIRNTGNKRLNVVVPPGLVAASTTGQAGRGLQSMGLGMLSNRPGSFGQFRGASAAGLRSVPVKEESDRPSVTIPAAETMELTIPAVCLNFGLPTPTAYDTFTLMDVDDYSADVRVRKSLRSLALLGTSQGVAQSVMWNVCNNLPFDTMVSQAAKVMNEHEVALAARFVEALDSSTGSDVVDAAHLTEGRLFVRVVGEGPLARDAKRLNDQMEKFRLLGLPVRVAEDGEAPAAASPALFVKVILTDSKIGETRGRIVVSYSSQADQWAPLGKANFQDNSSLEVLDGEALSRSLDRAIASAFVTVKPARRQVGSTTLKLENHLPFTLASVQVKTGTSAGAPSVPMQAIGVGPARSALLPIQAATATIERVELNGL